MIVAGDDDVVVAAAAPPQLLDSDELRRVCASICTVSLANDLRPLVATPLASAVRTLMVVGSSHRRGAVAQLSALVAALHARERAADDAVSVSGVLGDDDALVALLHAVATRALVDADAALVRDALALVVALLEAQFARPALGAYWSRQFFFECDFSESLVAVLLLAQANAPAAVDRVDCAPLAMHALAALCNARPVENADVREESRSDRGRSNIDTQLLTHRRMLLISCPAPLFASARSPIRASSTRSPPPSTTA